MMKNFKYILAVLLISALILPTFPAQAQFSDVNHITWAKDAINRLSDMNIIKGMGDGKFEPNQSVTRGQFACIIVRAFNPPKGWGHEFPDVKTGDYFHDDIQTARAAGIIMGREDGKFYPNEKVSRQDMFVMVSRAIASNNTGGTLNFKDNDKIAPYALDAIRSLLPYIKGDDQNNVRPRDPSSRAETAVFIDRVLNELAAAEAPSTAAPIVGTVFIRGEAEVSAQHAKDWARTRGATQKFVNAADNYWKYGAQTGIRADILYAQSAKETNFGLYTGAVTENMNNFAGIKTSTATGDETDDHERFATLDDGVRAHFNHMAAYIGAAPIGTPHARYHIAKNTAWAGTIIYVEELGGKWAPEPTYGVSILRDFLGSMKSFKFVPMNKNDKVVYISPSAQFANTYAAGDTNEGEQMNQVGALLFNELKSMGFNPIIANSSLNFQQRGDNAYAAGAFAYVALHTNANASSTLVKQTGTECWYRGLDWRSQSLSQALYDQVAPFAPGGPDRGLKDGAPRSLAEVRIPNMANCLIEIEFHDVPEMAEWIINNKAGIAQKIAKGISNYWNTL
ncbi:MAG: S-layer homology domain-containing protein [Oscillospiraceae bacterium]|nr:S-layer homology domain-containing protein [Oscillospiraceae bacterium]